MTPRIIAALAFSLTLGTAALAQTSTTTGTDTSSGAATGATTTLPTGWEGDIASAFFSDPTAGTLKSDEEIKSGWEGLSAEQQAQVKTDCQNQMASAGTSTTTGSGAATGSSDQAASADTSSGAASGGSDDVQTGSTSTNNMASSGSDTSGAASGAASATGSGDMMASLQQLCTTIQGM